MEGIKFFVWLGLVVALFVWPQAGLAQQSNDDVNAEINELKQEIRSLKQMLTAIRSDLQMIRKVELPEIKAIVVKRGGGGGGGSGNKQQVRDVDVMVNVTDNPFIGLNSAPLTLVEFSDFQCPFCARHNRNTLPKLDTEYVMTGKLKYVLRDMPLSFHREARGAAQAAWCANEQGKFWKMHEQMFANQRYLRPDDLVKHAEEIGLDVPAFQACFDSGKYKAQIDASVEEGRKLGLSGTPSFVLGYTEAGGTQVRGLKIIKGALSFQVFKATIDELLATN